MQDSVVEGSGASCWGSSTAATRFLAGVTRPLAPSRCSVKVCGEEERRREEGRADTPKTGCEGGCPGGGCVTRGLHRLGTPCPGPRPLESTLVVLVPHSATRRGGGGLGCLCSVPATSLSPGAPGV